MLYKQIIFIIALVACVTSYIDPPIALLLGIIIAQTTGHPFPEINNKIIRLLLQGSIIGLGFGMNLDDAANISKQGFIFTTCTIFGTLILGYIIGRALKIEKKVAFLTTAGTAICGGSAIAALSGVVRADDKQTAAALGIVYILNAVALFIFPITGHFFDLSQLQFGMWAAIAIHDTSSVVGAAYKYGQEALNIATTVKLERALWIIPMVIAASIIYKNKSDKFEMPYFILLFLAAITINTYMPDIERFSSAAVYLSKHGLTVTLFFIGTGLSGKMLKSLGYKPFAAGIILWLAISVMSLIFILKFV